MKKLLVLVMVLAMASLANATIIIQVDGQQTTDPESPINVMNGQVVTLGLYAQEEQGYFERLLGVTIDGTSEGAGGTFDLSAAVLDYKGDLSSLTLIDDPIGLFVGQVITTTFNDSADPPKTVIGQLASSISFTVSGAIGDDISLAYIAETGTLDGQVLHIIPEPITMVLLGLGGLMLRRRR